MLDWRPKKVSLDVTATFRTKSKESHRNDLLFNLQDKPLKPILRLAIPALELISLPDITEGCEDDFPEETWQEFRQLHTCFSLRQCATPQDVLVHRTRALEARGFGH